ncbi:MAG: type IV pilus twitching motility protein PilT [Sandaracinaceae bacterium]|jgi:twitching motility protein PilT|nr:type IV pilus twitching motility protein PilT [Sandaracinaceae bacterium]
MRRIDFYVQHLVKHDAQEIILSSGKPVTFRFASGDRHSNSAIEHGTIAQLVQECAPSDALDTLMRAGKARFTYRGDDGVEVNVVVEINGASTWLVNVLPANPAAMKLERTTAAAAAAASQRAGGGAAATNATTMPRPAGVGGAPGAIVPKPEAMKAAAPEIRLAPGEPAANRMLRLMMQMGASDLHVSSGERPMIRLHGEMMPLEEGAPKLDDATIRELLFPLAPERARKEFSERNDADFAYAIEGLARFRANFFVDRRGMGAVFRQIPFNIVSPEALGIPKQVLDLCWLSKGLVLVTGPTGSGKSTTLATLIDYINQNRSDHIITIEDPIEFVHDNKKCLVNQREVGAHTEGFKSALRAALREDPDIVLVGEMRDLETIAIAIETAETGHLVFGTLHTTTAPSTVDRIIDQFPADRQEQIRTMLSESLRGVISQVLCKKEGGGRVAAYEVLVANSAVANLIREGKTFQLVSVMQTGRNLGMQTMNDHLFEHVKAGRVDAKEAYVKAVDKTGLKEMFAKAGIALTL